MWIPKIAGYGRTPRSLALNIKGATKQSGATDRDVTRGVSGMPDPLGGCRECLI